MPRKNTLHTYYICIRLVCIWMDIALYRAAKVGCAVVQVCIHSKASLVDCKQILLFGLLTQTAF